MKTFAGSALICGLSLFGCAAPTAQAPSGGFRLTYSERRPGFEPSGRTLEAAFSKDARGALRVTFGPASEPLHVDERQPIPLGFGWIPSPAGNLPLWLPADWRTPGRIVYDDGEGFKHDRGRMAFRLGGEGPWKEFRAITLVHRYQGMRRDDNWTLAAYYDLDSGFLLSAEVFHTFGDTDHVTFALELKPSTKYTGYFVPQECAFRPHPREGRNAHS